MTTKSTKSGFTDAERAAMKERAEELRASGRGGNKKAEEAQALLDKIAEMPQPDRGYAERIHAIVTEVAPELHHKTWYGMPAYYLDGKPAIFFQPASKFDARYATLGFNDPAMLDDGNMWPTAYAVVGMSEAEEEQVRALVKKAVSR
ncbi:iron chaperone [Nocardioides sp. GXQ0305]|uniref:iron chaperone n=1 Tax=Nocardioides sp. GXQ0305 TaxID=3423912 RepID=UPI003D7D2FA5